MIDIVVTISVVVGFSLSSIDVCNRLRVHRTVSTGLMLLITVQNLCSPLKVQVFCSEHNYLSSAQLLMIVTVTLGANSLDKTQRTFSVEQQSREAISEQKNMLRLLNKTCADCSQPGNKI